MKILSYDFQLIPGWGFMKQMNKFVWIFSLVLLYSLSVDVIAQEKPVQLSLVTPIQIVPEDQSLKGFRFNLLYGKNASVSGLDIGLVNRTTEKQVAFNGGL